LAGNSAGVPTGDLLCDLGLLSGWHWVLGGNVLKESVQKEGKHNLPISPKVSLGTGMVLCSSYSIGLRSHRPAETQGVGGIDFTF
jgi:hypothetical protein